MHASGGYDLYVRDLLLGRIAEDLDLARKIWTEFTLRQRHLRATQQDRSGRPRPLSLRATQQNSGGSRYPGPEGEMSSFASTLRSRPAFTP